MIESKKYPRTFHLTWSEGCSNDDKMLDSNDYFLNQEIVISEKLDGSNLSFTNKDCFARTHTGPPTHVSFNLAKQMHANLKHLIPENYFIYMEYSFAKHSIFYSNLDSYFHIFNVLDQKNDRWLSWNNVLEISKIICLPTVPILFQGQVKSEKELMVLCNKLMKEKSLYGEEREGIVIRIADSFSNDNFAKSLAKNVRKNHVNTSDHWRNQEIIRNKLKA